MGDAESQPVPVSTTPRDASPRRDRPGTCDATVPPHEHRCTVDHEKVSVDPTTRVQRKAKRTQDGYPHVCACGYTWRDPPPPQEEA